MAAQPQVAYSGAARVAYGVHPMSPHCFAGTPAEGLVPGVDRMGWLVEDWCGNVVAATEVSELYCPHLPGTRVGGREVLEVAAVRTAAGWE